MGLVIGHFQNNWVISTDQTKLQYYRLEIDPHQYKIDVGQLEKV